MSTTVTLRQLARKLDIAPSTVSRALSGEPGVGPDMIRQVQQLAKAMNYRPAGRKRKLVRAIGLLCVTDRPGEPDDSFQQATIYDVTSAVADSNWHVHVSFVERDAVPMALPAVLRENRVDGVILAGHPRPEFCEMIRNEGYPIVVLQDTVERTKCTSVLPDVAGATETMTRRLVDMGHRRIGFVAMPLIFPTVQRRYDGFRRGIAATKNAGTSSVDVHVASSSLHQGQAAVRQLLQMPDRPTAIVFSTDRLAIGGMIELAHAGLDIPRQISIVGHDNTLLARESEPSLTSVELNSTLSAKVAVDLLQGMILNPAEEPPQQHEIPCHVMWRASSGPLFMPSVASQS